MSFNEKCQLESCKNQAIIIVTDKTHHITEAYCEEHIPPNRFASNKPKQEIKWKFS